MTTPFRYLSVCSGIEAASVAWRDLGWQAAGYSEIEPFASAVLKHHFPTTPNFGDITNHATWPINTGSIDLLVGGTPCQSFSVAGLRQGLADPRGNLALIFLAVADRLRPNWIVWENVPGVLSSGGGNDFRTFVNALVELRYNVAWRILDAQHFGIAQRRRRVFVVANAFDWHRSAAVLFESESLRRNCSPRGKTRKKIAADVGSGVAEIAATVTAKWAKGSGGPAGDECQNLVATPVPFVKAKRAQSVDDDETWQSERPAPTLSLFDSGDTRATVAIVTPAPPIVIDRAAFNQGEAAQYPPRIESSETMSTLVARGPHAIQAAAPLAVRRLTPIECERLQGFPDNWTDVPYRGKPAADGPRYRAIGNSMAVPVMSWIGRRIAAVDAAFTNNTNAENNSANQGE
jgi:DNA (cytosine-5)-methyltransferase 1